MGIYLILEAFNLSPVANSVVSVALAQRAMAEALSYAEQRAAFGKRILDHPLLRHQIQDRLKALRRLSAEAMKGVPQDAAPREMKVATKYEWASVAPFGSGD